MPKINVLVVEDESIVAMDIKQSLKKLGYDIAGVLASAEKAIELVKESKPDIILMDITLAGERSGTEAGEEIRDKFNIPVIYITAHTDEKTIQRAKRTTPYGYIVKPFKSVDIRSAIEMAIHKHRKQTALVEERDMLYRIIDQESNAGSLFIKTKRENFRRIKLKDIHVIEASADYAVIRTARERYTVHSSMKRIYDRLPEAEFARVHRSFIVRLDKIKEIDMKSDQLGLEGARELIPIGISFRKELLKKLNRT